MQLLGRATSIGAYVKRGEESGYIKICLRGDSKQEQLTITRKIDTRNKSEWLFNGKVPDFLITNQRSYSNCSSEHDVLNNKVKVTFYAFTSWILSQLIFMYCIFDLFLISSPCRTVPSIYVKYILKISGKLNPVRLSEA